MIVATRMLAFNLLLIIQSVLAAGMEWNASNSLFLSSAIPYDNSPLWAGDIFGAGMMDVFSNEIEQPNIVALDASRQAIFWTDHDGLIMSWNTTALTPTHVWHEANMNGDFTGLLMDTEHNTLYFSYGSKVKRCLLNNISVCETAEDVLAFATQLTAIRALDAHSSELYLSIFDTSQSLAQIGRLPLGGTLSELVILVNETMCGGPTCLLPLALDAGTSQLFYASGPGNIYVVSTTLPFSRHLLHTLTSPVTALAYGTLHLTMYLLTTAGEIVAVGVNGTSAKTIASADGNVFHDLCMEDEANEARLYVSSTSPAFEPHPLARLLRITITDTISAPLTTTTTDTTTSSNTASMSTTTTAVTTTVIYANWFGGLFSFAFDNSTGLAYWIDAETRSTLYYKNLLNTSRHTLGPENIYLSYAPTNAPFLHSRAPASSSSPSFLASSPSLSSSPSARIHRLSLAKETHTLYWAEAVVLSNGMTTTAQRVLSASALRSDGVVQQLVTSLGTMVGPYVIDDFTGDVYYIDGFTRTSGSSLLFRYVAASRLVSLLPEAQLGAEVVCMAAYFSLLGEGERGREPNGGLLFFSLMAAAGMSSGLVSSNLDGSNLQYIYKTANLISSITVEYRQNRVYWMEGMGSNWVVRRSDFSGDHLEVVTQLLSQFPSFYAFLGFDSASSQLFFVQNIPVHRMYNMSVATGGTGSAVVGDGDGTPTLLPINAFEVAEGLVLYGDLVYFFDRQGVIGRFDPQLTDPLPQLTPFEVIFTMNDSYSFRAIAADLQSHLLAVLISPTNPAPSFNNMSTNVSIWLVDADSRQRVRKVLSFPVEYAAADAVALNTGATAVFFAGSSPAGTSSAEQFIFRMSVTDADALPSPLIGVSGSVMDLMWDDVDSQLYWSLVTNVDYRLGTLATSIWRSDGNGTDVTLICNISVSFTGQVSGLRGLTKPGSTGDFLYAFLPNIALYVIRLGQPPAVNEASGDEPPFPYQVYPLSSDGYRITDLVAHSKEALLFWSRVSDDSSAHSGAMAEGVAQIYSTDIMGANLSQRFLLQSLPLTEAVYDFISSPPRTLLVAAASTNTSSSSPFANEGKGGGGIVVSSVDGTKKWFQQINTTSPIRNILYHPSFSMLYWANSDLQSVVLEAETAHVIVQPVFIIATISTFDFLQWRADDRLSSTSSPSAFSSSAASAPSSAATVAGRLSWLSGNRVWSCNASGGDLTWFALDRQWYTNHTVSAMAQGSGVDYFFAFHPLFNISSTNSAFALVADRVFAGDSGVVLQRAGGDSQILFLDRDYLVNGKPFRPTALTVQMVADVSGYIYASDGSMVARLSLTASATDLSTNFLADYSTGPALHAAHFRPGQQGRSSTLREGGWTVNGTWEVLYTTTHPTDALVISGGGIPWETINVPQQPSPAPTPSPTPGPSSQGGISFSIIITLASVGGFLLLLGSCAVYQWRHRPHLIISFNKIDEKEQRHFDGLPTSADDPSAPFS